MTNKIAIIVPRFYQTYLQLNQTWLIFKYMIPLLTLLHSFSAKERKTISQTSNMTCKFKTIFVSKQMNVHYKLTLLNFMFLTFSTREWAISCRHKSTGHHDFVSNWISVDEEEEFGLFPTAIGRSVTSSQYWYINLIEYWH